MPLVNEIFWRQVTNADFFNIERARGQGPSTGGGQLWVSISFGAHLDHAAFGAFLGIEPPEAVTSTRPRRTIQVHALHAPDAVGPLEFGAHYRPGSQGDDRYYIARQNRRRPRGERHPAWMPDSGFPHAPEEIDDKDHPSIPDLSQLKILVLRAEDGSYHASFVNTRKRPSGLPDAVDVLFRPNPTCPPDGLIQLEADAVSLEQWRTSLDSTRVWSRDGLVSAPEIEDAIDATSQAAGGRVSGQGRTAGQGFRQSWPERAAIERRAMDVATSHFEELDWKVRDVSANHSYDLRCTKRRDVLHVEVKGTTGDGSAVLLTPNEVTAAGEHHPNTALVVVSEVVLDLTGEVPQATGGTIRVIQPWHPDSAGDLHPIGFRYLLHP